MNLDQIASRIARPETCLGSEIPALKELTEKYPYAQVFSILYLKALSNQNDIGFDEALQKHAYRVTDRMKLYDLIHEREEIAGFETGETEAGTEDIVVTSGKTDAVIAADPVVTPLDPPSRGEEVALEPIGEDEVIEADFVGGEEIVEEDVVVTPLSRDTIVTPLDPPSKGEDVPEPIAEEDLTPAFITDELELEIISQVVATVYNENLEHSVPERKTEEKAAEEKKSEPLITRERDAENAVTESRRSFSSWLKAGSATKPKAEEKSEAETPETVVQPEKPAEKQVNKIIDEFIEKEPTISRPKKEFYSPTKKAKESISAEGLIYTETLADIFAIQGNFPKAIKAYEQLMLTNPEKKIFFAQRIKELKEKLNT